MVENGHKAEDVQDFVAIARIGKAVGLDGWCKLFPYGESLEKVEVPTTVWMGHKGPSEEVVLSGLKFEGNSFKGRFEGYEQREDVSVLTNADLFLPRNKLPAKGPDEHYHFELEGMAVIGDSSRELIGTVIEVHNYPTTDALEIRKKSGYMFILPMTKELLLEIDTAQKQIVVDEDAINELL